MINADSPAGLEASDAAVHAAANSGARGALALAGIASLIVMCIWLGFYLFIFIPRATP